MPLQATSGSASYDAFGGGVAAVPQYIEDVFSTYLYTGNSSTQTITNGIDLSTKGGFLWTKTRSSANSHNLFDSTRALNQTLSSNTTQAQQTINNGNPLTFNTNGFSLPNSNDVNVSGTTYASWTFRKQPKFFDVVTYTGTGGSLTVNHNLGSTPGCIIVKRINSTSDWFVHHQDVNYDGSYLKLNSTAANNSGSVPPYFLISVTDTYFTMQATGVANVSGATYVAYLFAHDAGGFGLTGTDNVISCGSYTGAGASTTVTLGYEPQWVMIRNTAGPFPWWIQDNMRGMTVTGDNGVLNANSSAAEAARGSHIVPTATGFTFTANEGDLNGAGSTYIYIAIRRGPMKVPTSGTSVFATALGVATTPNMVAGFPVDSFLGGDRDTPTSTNWKWWDRLRGNVASLLTTTTAAEDTSEYNYGQFQSMTGFISGNYDASDKIGWMFRRAPSFFDEVCYTGTGGTGSRNLNHNLTVAPELLIIKQRSTAGSWIVYNQTIGAGNRLLLQGTNASGSTTSFASTAPTASVFTVDAGGTYNTSSTTFVAYLFATCAGVSKVTSFTGNGSSQTINCGFTAGSRFVMIKRTDSTGDWYVWDSARGIVSGNDPHLSLNSTAAEVTTDDTIDTDSTGFIVNQVSATNCNVNGASYIVLAIA